MNFPPRAGRVSGRATPSLRHAPRAKLQRTNPGSSPLSLRGILFRGSGLALSLRCCICRKELSDSESIARGIGSDCWQDVLRAIEEGRLKAKESVDG